MELTAVQRRTLADLLGPGADRAFPQGLASDLREAIDDGIAPSLPLPGPPLRLWKERLNGLGRCEGLFDADLAGERPPFVHSDASAAGTLSHKSIELDVSVPHEVDADELVDRAAEHLGADRQFALHWGGLDAIGRAELRMQALRSLEQFRASFPPLRALRRELAPVTELWLEARVGGGSVRVLGKVDLLLNRSAPGRASRVLIDLKGGRARSEHHEDMRLYALLYTLRTGVPPLRVATFLLSSGEWQPEEVTEEMLERAANRVVTAVGAAARGLSGGAPLLAPGPHCLRCPRRPNCAAAARLEAPGLPEARL
jgi:hypothetical protein